MSRIIGKILPFLLMASMMDDKINYPNGRHEPPKPKRKICPICSVEHGGHSIFCCKEHFLQGRKIQKEKRKNRRIK